MSLEPQKNYQQRLDQCKIRQAEGEFAISRAGAPDSSFWTATPSGTFGTTDTSGVSAPATETHFNAAVVDSRQASEFYGMPGCNYLSSAATHHEHFDRKQLLNAFYYMAATACLVIIAAHMHIPHAARNIWGSLIGSIAAVLITLQLVGARFAFVRPKPSDFEVTLSASFSRSLRYAALLLPLPLFVGATMVVASDVAYKDAQTNLTAERYKASKDLLNRAIFFNPFNEPALASMAYTENCLFEYPGAINFADRALALKHKDAAALADKAWALNALDRFKEALPVALRSTMIDPENGEAQSSLADAYAGMGNYEAALQASLEHLAIHSTERAAYNQHADMLEHLQRVDEANEIREQGKAYR